MKTDIHVSYEPTPNPQSMKFNFDQVVAQGSHQFDGPEGAELSPLAHKLFGFPWAEAIYVDQQFVTITKQDWVEWDIIAEPLAQLIKEHIDEGGEVLLSSDQLSAQAQAKKQTADESTQILDTDSEEIKKIKTSLNNDIRPMVAMDGGDISFVKYEDGRVYVQLKGACNACPSSEMTLKNGIEVRLKEILPEIKEVLAV